MSAKPFAILHTWPDIRNAEHEVLQRVLIAARNVGLETVVIDNAGLPLWCSPGADFPADMPVDGDALSFLLSLHFESPRLIDAYSYVTLWQPLEFYHQFGYRQSAQKLVSHSDVLSCGSEAADSHALNLFIGTGRRLETPLALYHNVAEPYLAPAIGPQSRLFYIGINWERLGRPKGRFHDALIALDALDLVDIYGPRSFLGKEPWAGFAAYRGELPFDGESVKAAINASGVCLALSSEAHKRAGIMSNRLFEGFGGGAAVIATPNPFIDRHLRHTVYEVDDARGEDALARQIAERIAEIRRDPAGATQRVLEAQSIIAAHYSLERSLERLVAETPARRARAEATPRTETVTVVLLWRDGSAADCVAAIERLAQQRGVRIDLRLIVDEGIATRRAEALRAAATGAITALTVHPASLSPRAPALDVPPPPRRPSGPMIREALAAPAGDFFCILGPDDLLFGDHLARLAAALRRHPPARAARGAPARQRTEANGRVQRVHDPAVFADQHAMLHASGPFDTGSWLFDTALLSSPATGALDLLDGGEGHLLRLLAAIECGTVDTGYVTHLTDETVRAQLPLPVVPPNAQADYIRDAVAADPRWRRLIHQTGAPPAFVQPASAAVGLRWEDYPGPDAAPPVLTPGPLLSTADGAPGAAYLAGGFHPPEADGAWIGAEKGTIAFSVDESAWPPDELHEIVLVVLGRRTRSTGREQHCTVAINGAVVAYVPIPDTGRSEVRVAVPLNLRRGLRKFWVELYPDHAEEVYRPDGSVTDPRRLGIKVFALGFQAKLGIEAPKMRPWLRYGFGAGERGVPLLAQGFHAPEKGFAWMAGQGGLLRLRIAGRRFSPATLRIRLAGRSSMESGGRQTVTFSALGRVLGEAVLDDRPRDTELRIPVECLRKGHLELSIVARHAEAVFDAATRAVADSRLLGVRLVEARLLPGRPGRGVAAMAERIGVAIAFWRRP